MAKERRRDLGQRAIERCDDVVRAAGLRETSEATNVGEQDGDESALSSEAGEMRWIAAESS